tara:strand:+ start:819 stop:1895 length:1077 start_codon:yes stop_codon:yes gene_type:complete
MGNFKLTDNQKKAILDEWNSRPDSPPALLDLIRLTFPDQNLDGRTKEGKAVKAFLASRDIKARGAHEYKAKKKIDLTDEDKTFIESNVEFMSSVEMARVLFKDPELSNLNQEARVVSDFIKDLEPAATFESPDEVPTEEYKPPKTFDKTLFRVNRYTNGSINKNKITVKVKKNIESLISYVNTYRFCYQINTYVTTTDRELFESSFIRYTHDKPDLTQEEVDQYIVLSSEVVISASIQRRKEHLTGLLDNIVEDDNGRASMSLVEAIGKTETEYNQSVNRQQKLLNDLKEKRSDRLRNQIKENASILNLVKVWKDEESRVKLIKLSEVRRKSVKEEAENLSSMDEVKARILGLDEEEI